MNQAKEFDGLIAQVNYGNRWTTFQDFCTYGFAILTEDKDILKRLEARYDSKQMGLFAQMLKCTQNALEAEFQDFLGNRYMANQLGNSHSGQFFTPYHLSRMIAAMVGYNKKDLEKGYLTLLEPAAGAGGMIIAYADILKKEGISPELLRVEAWDIDQICWKMCFIQLSLLGIPARIINGDTLRMEIFQEIKTKNYNYCLVSPDSLSKSSCQV